MAEHVLDAKGLNCPLPSTDPGSVADFEAFCRTTGNELLESKTVEGVYTFLIKHTA
jgi:tRNA 2-thiouridine synthesizing protein A